MGKLTDTDNSDEETSYCFDGWSWDGNEKAISKILKDMSFNSIA